MYSKKKMNRTLSKRRRVSKGKKIAVAFVCIVFSVGILSLCLIEGGLVKESKRQSSENEQSILIAKETIAQGTVITSELVTKVSEVMPVGSDFLAGNEVIGQKARQEIPKGMILYDFLVAKQLKEKSQREIECDVVRLSKNLKELDYADIRLKLPNGEDYIVLSKKQIHSLTKGEDGVSYCYLWVEEEEILNLQAAVVDAFFYPGAYLYTTKYIEPGVQTKSYVTYVPSVATLELMKKDQNLLDRATDLLKEQQRKGMEGRLMDYRNEKMREYETDWETRLKATENELEHEIIFEEEVP